MRALTADGDGLGRDRHGRGAAVLERVHAGRVGCRVALADPRAAGAPHGRRPKTSRRILEPFKGHRMAKAGIELAVLDAALRAEGRSLGEYLGAMRDRVPVGRLGRHPARPGRARRRRRRIPRRGLRAHQDQDQARPRRRRDRARCARRSATIPLQVDANSAYTLADVDTLAELDRFDLLLIEQPLQEDDLVDHADARPARAHPDLPGRVDRVAQGRRRRPRAGRGIHHQHQGGPGRRLPRGASRSTTCAGMPASRCGAAACSRPASAAPRTPRSPPCPASRCRATCRRRAASITATSSPSRPCSRTATCACRPGTGIGVEIDHGRARGLHRRPRDGAAVTDAAGTTSSRRDSSVALGASPGRARGLRRLSASPCPARRRALPDGVTAVAGAAALGCRGPPGAGRGATTATTSRSRSVDVAVGDPRFAELRCARSSTRPRRSPPGGTVDIRIELPAMACGASGVPRAAPVLTPGSATADGRPCTTRSARLRGGGGPARRPARVPRRAARAGVPGTGAAGCRDRDPRLVHAVRPGAPADLALDRADGARRGADRRHPDHQPAHLRRRDGRDPDTHASSVGRRAASEPSSWTCRWCRCAATRTRCRRTSAARSSRSRSSSTASRRDRARGVRGDARADPHLGRQWCGFGT